MGVELGERFKKEPIVIGVFGEIGVGKSTLSTLLSKKLGLVHLQEDFPHSPFLEDFYEDPTRWSFHSQVWFFAKKIEQLKSMNPAKSYLIDPAIEMDRLYAKTLSRVGFMSKSEFRTYDDLFESLIEEGHIRKPSLYLLVDARLSVLRPRIIKRARPFEMKMLKEYPYYLSELRSVIKEFVSSQKRANVIYVNANKDNFIDTIHINGIIEKIKRNI